jgi:hypothetical protein
MKFAFNRTTLSALVLILAIVLMLFVVGTGKGGSISIKIQHVATPDIDIQINAPAKPSVVAQPAARERRGKTMNTGGGRPMESP